MAGRDFDDQSSDIQGSSGKGGSGERTRRDSKDEQKKEVAHKLFPLDIAIALSIISAAGTGGERAKRFCQSVLVVGGGAIMVNGFARLLEERLSVLNVGYLSAYSDSLSAQTQMQYSDLFNQPSNSYVFPEKLTVMPPPRDMDPRILAWGGAVVGRIEPTSETWITEAEWKARQEAALFARGWWYHILLPLIICIYK